MNLYEGEPENNIFCMDSKSFYASVECRERGLDPMETMLVVVSGERNGAGLILAASPEAKRVLGIKNVNRGFEVPYHPDLYIVPPRMNLYITYHMRIIEIFRRYMADEDIHVYSIDEQFGDLTKSWRLFGSSPEEVARKIQLDVYHEMGIYTTIGLSVNPLLAKVAMDTEAKKSKDFFAEWGYKDVPEKLWPLKLADFWGIGHRMERNFQAMGFNTIGDIAHTNPYQLKEKFGVMGLQYYMHAWGIDRSILADKKDYQPKEKSIGNSQVLAKGYVRKTDILVVLYEMCEQVSQRLRKADVVGETLHVGMSYAYISEKKRGGFSRQLKIEATNQAKVLSILAKQIFEKFWNGSEIRTISVTVSSLSPAGTLQLNLFEEPQTTIKNDKIDDVIAQIRNKYSFTAIMRAHSTLEGATAVSRARLVGGHAGGMDGLE